jgi:hypothetical protein
LLLLGSDRLPQSAPPAAAASATAPPSAGPAASELTDPSNPPAPKKRRPLEIRNACGQIVTVVFGEDPNAKGAGSRTIAASSSIDGPRDDEGNLTVNLLDDRSQPIAKVHVTKRMTRVEIGASCRTLDAR